MIWIPDQRKIRIEKSGAGDGFVWVKTSSLTIVSCYFTPSEDIASFVARLGNLEDVTGELGHRVIVMGDFNSKAVEWGEVYLDSRGKRILEMGARRKLIVLNIGTATTFRAVGRGETQPDVTFATESIAAKITV